MYVLDNPKVNLIEVTKCSTPGGQKGFIIFTYEDIRDGYGAPARVHLEKTEDKDVGTSWRMVITDDLTGRQWVRSATGADFSPLEELEKFTKLISPMEVKAVDGTVKTFTRRLSLDWMSKDGRDCVYSNDVTGVNWVERKGVEYV